jgi:hypothetical protein
VKKWCFGEIQGKIKQSVCFLKHFGAKKFAFVLYFLQKPDNQHNRSLIAWRLCHTLQPSSEFQYKIKGI